MATDPTGAVVRNLFQLQRLSNGLGKEASAIVRELIDEIAAEIARIDPTSPPQQTYRQLRVQKLMEAVEDVTGEAFEDVRRRLRDDLARVGKSQGQWAAGQLDRALGGAAIDIRRGAIGINQMKRILDARPFRGETLAGWAETQAAATVRRVRRQVQLGMVQSETIDDIIRRIRGVSDGRGGFRRGVLDTTTREAEAIARTAVNFTANTAHRETFKDNQNITKSFEYTATLDSRTTLICAKLDGMVWKYDDPNAKYPPQHFNCRSTITPRVDWGGLGVQPPQSEGKRASADGQVPASTTYREWLKDQPASVQNEVLGRSRADLFRAGKVDLRDLVTRDNRVVPVSELVA